MVTARQGGRRQTSEQVTVTVDVHLNKDTITDSEAKRVDDGGKHGRDNPDLEDTAVSDKRSEDDAGRVLVRSKDGNICLLYMEASVCPSTRDYHVSVSTGC